MPAEDADQEAPKALKEPLRTVLRKQGYTHCDGNGGMRVLPQRTTLSAALKVHPRGFRLLSSNSPIERSLGSYFRLPPPPSKKQAVDMARVKHMLKMKGNQKRQKKTVLDGFILLKACGVEDPTDAIEASLPDAALTSVVAEDLSFFTNLQYLDLGENTIDIQDLVALGKLEELHLHCACLSSLVIPRGAFPCLEAINLSFNSFTDPSVIATLSHLPNLSRLDLSGNMFATLPDSEVMKDGFHNLHQLALERNKLSTEGVFKSLSVLPCLQEINLNHNALSKFPSFPSDDSAPPLFTSLQVISIAANEFRFFEDLFSLTKCKALKRAVLWGNPLERRRADVDILVHEMGKVGVVVYLEGPLPPKRSVGEFYIANSKNMVKVAEFKKLAKDREQKVDKQPTQAEEETNRMEPAASAYSSTFFMTEPKIQESMGHTAGKEQHPHPPLVDASWFSIDDGPEPYNFEAEVQGIMQSSPTPKGSVEAKHSIKSAFTALKHALNNPLTNPVSTNLIRRGPRRKHRYINALAASQSPTPSAKLPPLSS